MNAAADSGTEQDDYLYTAETMAPVFQADSHSRRL
jgi:hypothetical protein